MWNRASVDADCIKSIEPARELRSCRDIGVVLWARFAMLWDEAVRAVLELEWRTGGREVEAARHGASSNQRRVRGRSS